MPDLRRSAPILLALAVLFPLGASTPLACCAGVAAGAHATAVGAASHCGGGHDGDGGGDSCCERAAQDAAARHCCQGGDAFERPQPGHQPILGAAPALLGPPIPSAGALFGAPFSPRDPVPRLEPLYTLHSSLLI
jgi:hypothetical protein